MSIADKLRGIKERARKIDSGKWSLQGLQDLLTSLCSDIAALPDPEEWAQQVSPTYVMEAAKAVGEARAERDELAAALRDARAVLVDVKDSSRHRTTWKRRCKAIDRINKALLGEDGA